MYDLIVHVNNEEDLYNNFDSSKHMLSDDLIEYIEKQLEDRERGDKVRIIFECSTPIDEARIRDASNFFYESLQNSVQRQIKLNRGSSIYLMLVGVVFVIVGILLENHINTVIATIISTVGSFSIWEAANIWIKELPKLNIKRSVTDYLKDYELVITNK